MLFGDSADVLFLYTRVIPTVLRKMIKQYQTMQIQPVMEPRVDADVGDDIMDVVCVTEVVVVVVSRALVAWAIAAWVIEGILCSHVV